MSTKDNPDILPINLEFNRAAFELAFDFGKTGEVQGETKVTSRGNFQGISRRIKYHNKKIRANKEEDTFSQVYVLG